MTDEITPAAGSPEALVLALIALVTNPKAAKDHVLAIVAERAKADKATAAADKREAAADARTAAADKRDQEIMVHEQELNTAKQLFKGERAELMAIVRHNSEIESQIKLRLLRHADVLHNFNPEIQSMPSWAAVDREFGVVDAHYDGNEGSARPETSLENEAPENLVQGSTLTRRSPKPPRPSRADL